MDLLHDIKTLNFEDMLISSIKTVFKQMLSPLMDDIKEVITDLKTSMKIEFNLECAKCKANL